MKNLLTCPVCQSSRMYYAVSVEQCRLVACQDCGHRMLDPLPSAKAYRVPDGDVSGLRAYIRRYRGIEGRVFVYGQSELPEEAGVYDACILGRALDYVHEPQKLLARVHAMLKPGGVVVVVTRAVKSIPREVQPHYFHRDTAHSLLFHAWFGRTIGLEEDNTVLTLATRQDMRTQRRLSIIMPVYNEAGTVATVLDALLKKDLEPLEKEIVVIDNHSTDVTPEILRTYASHPQVKLVFERRPGKGSAVRTGLRFATGDFMLIQDADLEYDLEDYEVLLEPLYAGRRAFILGSRHGGGAWKMRTFADAPFLGNFLNFGHWLFRTMLNVLYGVSLKDPFTMYKVFRRDCLEGLRFECDRFDFDHELVIKLVQKGYIPEEIPVNYRSRSFKEGKKVSMIRDPLTWLKTQLKFKFQKQDLLGNIEAERRREGGTEEVTE